jgi:hypothetical protein
MDDKLKAALEFSNYRLTLNNQKQNLKQRMITMLTIGYASALFTARPELIVFVKQLVDSNVEKFVLLDDNDNPVLISDLADFHSKLISAYSEAMNEYYTESQNLKKHRDTKSLIGING